MYINYSIIALLIIIIFFTNHKTKESYSTMYSDLTPTSITNQKFLEKYSDTGLTSLGSRNKKYIDFGNFGTIGDFPSIPICNSCGLEYNCVNYDYQSTDDLNMNVCRKCEKNGTFKNYGNLKKPLYVYARSAGRPRQCRLII